MMPTLSDLTLAEAEKFLGWQKNKLLVMDYATMHRIMDASLTDCLTPPLGIFVYYDDLYIEIHAREFYLIVGNQDWLSTDLLPLEILLWKGGIAEGMIS